MSRRVAVVGAGIAGLAVAFEILDRATSEIELVCLDGAERAGGHLRSTREDGFLYEWGATGFLDNAAATLDLVRRLGLEQDVVQAGHAAARRYVFARGKLREIPLSPPALLTSGVLTLPALVRLLWEPMVSQRPPTAGEETVFDFASRRVGAQAASILIDALTTGIFAGDVRRLSLEATYPTMRQMETEHGSLFRAMLARRKQRRKRGDASGGPAGAEGRLTSFRDGMQSLSDALARALGPRLRLNTPVERVSHLGRRGFRLHLREGAPMEFDAVVLACPARPTAGIVEEMDGELSSLVAAIHSAPVTVVHLGYRRDALPTRPDGFGYLVPRGQGLRTLLTLWPSDIFDGRAPRGGQLLSTMIGGVHDPAAGEMDDSMLIRLTKSELETAMDIRTDPYFARVTKNPVGIPQYEVGHLGRVAAVGERLRASPGLWIAGNSLQGVSVNLCIQNAVGIADKTIEYLNEPVRVSGRRGSAVTAADDRSAQRIAGQVVLVTGASSGIGAACARAFAGSGARLLIAARRLDRLTALGDELTAAGAADLRLHELDVRDPGAVAGWIDSLSGNWAEIEVLINNAGLSRGLAPLHEGALGDWNEMIDTNVRGLLHVDRAVVPLMVARGRGTIVHIGSVAGHEVYPGGNVYCATKHAVRAITGALRLDLVGTGVRVCSIDPGMVETEFSEVRFHGDKRKAAAVYRGMTPLRAEDVADVVLFAATRPDHVALAEVLLLPTDQASATRVHRRD